MEADEFDLAATGVGVVEEDAVLGPERVRPGDVAVAMASSGLHSNGYSLVRHVLFDRDRMSLEDRPDELGGRVLGEELLEPTRIYAKDCLALLQAGLGVRTFAHVTGGGLAENLARVLPAGVEAVLERSSWSVPGIFRLVGDRGGLAEAEIERTLNMGVGMVALLDPADADRAIAKLTSRGVPSWVLGEVRAAEGPGTVRLNGTHPA
jgi:phosphoribosylformylglycinamidine cyclo-ligase